MLNNRDSFDKIVGGYFAALTKQPFEFKGKIFTPKPLVITPLLLRGFTCPAHCGACCARVTLDYLPTEKQPELLSPRTVQFNRQAFTIFSDLQDDRDAPKCRHLRYEDGRCNIHEKHPMLCDVELIKFIHYEERAVLLSKLYGRGWALTRVTGDKGAQCSMLPVTPETIADVVRKLQRIREWCIYFQLDSWIDDIIAWVKNYPSETAMLRLSVTGETKQLGIE